MIRGTLNFVGGVTTRISAENGLVTSSSAKGSLYFRYCLLLRACLVGCNLPILHGNLMLFHSPLHHLDVKQNAIKFSGLKNLPGPNYFSLK